MRRLLQELGGRLKGFVDQRENVAMVVRASEADTLPILTLLDGVEAERASDMFWTFTDVFIDADAYAQAIVSAFSVRHEGTRLALEKEGLGSWPPLPEDVTDASAPPSRRLRALAAFSRRLLPVPNGGVVVWTLFPLAIEDPADYAALMRQLLHHEFPNPWCHNLRFVIRDDAARPFLSGSRMARVEELQPDLSAEAVRRSIEADAEDESLALDERMGNLAMLAGIDFAEHRYEESLDKYGLLLQFYAPAGNHAMGALALNGMGESYERMGDLESAGDSYQAALIPASHGEHPPVPVLLNVLLNLANLRFKEERFEESEGYFDAAQQMATVARNGPVKVQALDGRGLAQHRQGKREEAEKSWDAGAIIAAQLEDVGLCRTLVARLHQFYGETGQREKERERARQLAGLDGHDVE